MSTILKEDVLHGKNRESSAKEKVDKIMNTIVELSETSSLAKTESVENSTSSGAMKSREDDARQYIFSSEILIDGEKSADLDEVRNKLIKELKPSNVIEALIVDRIISGVWRLKRCLKIESQILEYNTSCIQEYEQGFLRTRKRTNRELLQLKAVKINENKNRSPELSKYETMLENQIYKALRELDKYRRRELRQEKKSLRGRKTRLGE
ncbi:MAG: hypothetical protein CV087_12450 [Candidatus Brocadia sp. WS118]|nr:MAG: hypothetical protein CV087_12450 [Candidatus Brocadia sp. WS118]